MTMRNILPLILLSLSFSQSIDQDNVIYEELKAIVQNSTRSSQRVFFDYFGGEYCTYCPAVSMALSQLLDDYPETVVMVEWADPYWTPSPLIMTIAYTSTNLTHVTTSERVTII